MRSECDMVVRGGTVVDGSGSEPFIGDVAIHNGKIFAVGAVDARGVEEIDARGKIVTPGFVDIHTHYDGQVVWESRLQPSSGHGVTTIVTGNCGVGFAPCRLEDHEALVALMAGVEDIPEVVMVEGLPWTWETFPDYLDAVAARPHDVDIAAMVPHSALRVYAMGQRAINRERATDADVATMAALVEEAMAAGAIGLGTSRAIQQKSIRGEPIPTVGAGESELAGILKPVAEAGGVFQALSDFDLFKDVEGEFGMFRRLVDGLGLRMSFTLNQKHSDPDGWRRLLALTEAANDDGLTIKGQVLGRPTGLLLGHELTQSPFSASNTYRALGALTFAAKIAELRKPDVRAAIIAEAQASNGRSLSHMFELGEEVDYEPSLDDNIEAKALRAGVSPYEYVYDYLLEEDGRKILFDPAQNFADGSLSAPYEMMKHRDTILGLGDGGAHCGLICDASFPTTMLAYWTRDRVRGPQLALPEVVRMLSAANASAMGLSDRGLLATGYKADINVIDYDALKLHRPEAVYDLPSGGRRIVQRADGYAATIVSGQVTYRKGEATGALPGKVVRGPQAA
ncbi:MAG: amidohydrolase family protein, partial [Sphingobium sp.]